MNKFLYLLSIVLTVMGVILLISAILQNLNVISLFDNPPYLVGAGLAAVGGTMVAGYKSKMRKKAQV